MNHSDLSSSLRNLAEFYLLSLIAGGFAQEPSSDNSIKVNGNFVIDGYDITSRNYTLNEVNSAIAQYAANDLPNLVFLSVISKLESRIITELTRRGLSASGTFGNIQKRLENSVSISNNNIIRMDEIRNRRNCIVHHGGIANQTYEDASRLLNSIDPNHIVTTNGRHIVVDIAYIEYQINTSIDYSREII